MEINYCFDTKLCNLVVDLCVLTVNCFCISNWCLQDTYGPTMPKPFQSMLSRIAPQPQATSTPAMGATSIGLSGMVNNEDHCVGPEGG